MSRRRDTQAQSPTLPLGLLALALGGFGIGLTEFGIVGLLPQIASDLAVTEPVAGYLVSGYALSVAVGAVALTAALGRFDRKNVLMGLLVLFVLGNFMSAIAPTYAALMSGRIVAALCHGAFFGVGAVVAADMVASDRRAGAIAFMFGGLTVANVLGVPAGHAAWPATRLARDVLGPDGHRPCCDGRDPSSGSANAGAHGDEPSWRARCLPSAAGVGSLAASVLAFGGVVAGFTYIAFTLTEVTGFATTTVPWLLVLFGVGTLVGNFVGGKSADRALNASLIVLLALLTLTVTVFALTAQSKIMTILSLLLMGAIGLAAAPGLQVRIMRFAPDAPVMASGANIAAFNIGNALGAWLGGLALDAGFGYVSPLWVGAGLAATGLAVVAAGAVPPDRTPEGFVASETAYERKPA